jgi:hypothetical protein
MQNNSCYTKTTDLFGFFPLKFKLGPVLLKYLRLRPKPDYGHYFLIEVDLKIIQFFFYKELRKMFLGHGFPTEF